MAFEPAFDIPHPAGQFPPAYDLSGIIPPVAATRNFVFGDGVDNYIGADTPRTASGDFEFSALIQTSSNRVQWQTIFGNDHWLSQLGFVIIIRSGMIAYISAGDSGVLQGSTAISDGRLHTIRVTRTGNTVRLYADGNLEATGTPPLRANANANSFRIGSRHENGGTGAVDFFDGVIANVNFISGWNQNELFEINGSDAGLTYNNFQSDDIRSFTQNADGDWLGVEQATVSSTPVLGDDSDPEILQIVASAIANGTRIRASARFTQFIGVNNAGFTGNGVPTASPFRLTAGSVGDIVGGDFTVSSSASVLSLFGRAASQVAYDQVTVRELLEVA